MISKLVNYLKNKKILILGLGLEGYSTYSFIRKHLSSQMIYISDANVQVYSKYEDIVNDSNIEFISENQYLKGLEKYDIIMKTPGISFAKIDTSSFIDKIKTQLELFLEFVDVFTIGVTGTKGKSTTSSLIYEILKDQLNDVFLLGNIGIPVFEKLDEIKKETKVVLELSSHQLEYVKVSPNIAIVLNIFEEHLDHYKSYNHYINAKLNIFKYQKENDYCLYNIDNNDLMKNMNNLSDLKQHRIEVSLKNNSQIYENSRLVTIDNGVIFEGEKILYKDSDNRNLLGDHNLNNIMFAIEVANIMKLDLNKATKIIYNFMPLEHRLEYVGQFNEVKYYNDSIATIPEAAINAVNTLKNVGTLIIGGKDRGVNQDSVINFLNEGHVKNIICLPDTGHIIASKLNNKNIIVKVVNNMEEAVKAAIQLTQKGRICVLSPAASSYGFFKNFKERGDLFKKLVKEYNKI